MEGEQKQYSDMSYAKKNKELCVYCSYRVAVPSKNFLFCSEMCRLLHCAITKEPVSVEDIAKFIKLPKIELISIILTLKCQELDKDELFKIFNKKVKNDIFSLKVNKDEKSTITFD